MNGIGLAALLASCGYPGDPLPPALNRPVRVTNLTAVERGSKIEIEFTMPATTTEGQPLRGKPDVELRLGPSTPGGFSLPKWEASSERVPASDIHIANLRASAEFDASKFYGTPVLIAVRVHGPHGQDVGWSRIETVDVVPALPVPEGLTVNNAPDATRLDWHAAAPEFRIFRKTPEDSEFRQVGTSDKPFYLDTTIEYGKTYTYEVQSIQKTGDRYAESEASTSVTFKPVDKFPPAVPVGLTAVPGSRSIELVWERNTERDFASYQIYRDGKKIAEGFTSPSFSDKDLKPGIRYRYQVAATDTAGNASELSAPVETAIP